MINLRETIFLLLVTYSSILSTFLTKAECPVVETVENFDIEEYACECVATRSKYFQAK